MKSSTKVELEQREIEALCAAGGFGDIRNVRSLGAGEFNAVYAFESGDGEYALKIAPDSRKPVMAYEKNMMRSEVLWYGQMRAHTQIRTPEVLFTDFSRTLLQSDYFIMQLIPGKQMNEMEFTPQERADATEKLPQMAAQIHRIANSGFGYPHRTLYDSWDKALAAMVGELVADAAVMGKPCENGKRVLALIDRHSDVLAAAPCRMVNFDLWETNILCERADGGMRYTWIDPERGFWGDPVMDFVCFETHKPFTEKRASLKAYNLAAETPLSVTRETEIRFAFAQAYLGLIMEVERYFRYTPGDEGWQRNNCVYPSLLGSAFACLEAKS